MLEADYYQNIAKGTQRAHFLTALTHLPIFYICHSFGFHHLWTALAAFPAVDLNKKTAPFKSKHHYKRTDKAGLDKLSI